jgi:hypothetical protein
LITAGTKEVNICRSRQLSFVASVKKFHPIAPFGSAISYNIVLFETAEHIFANK